MLVHFKSTWMVASHTWFECLSKHITVLFFCVEHVMMPDLEKSSTSIGYLPQVMELAIKVNLDTFLQVSERSSRPLQSNG